MSLINNLLIKSLTFIIKESYGKTKKKKKIWMYWMVCFFYGSVKVIQFLCYTEAKESHSIKFFLLAFE